MSALIHLLTNLQAPVVLVTSRPSLFCAAIITTNINICNGWPPFLRTYGVNLPSSLTTHNSYTLVLLYQSTSVGLRYGYQYLFVYPKVNTLEVFPGELIQQIGFPKVTFASQFVCIYRSRNISPDLPEETNLLLTPQTNKGLAFSIPDLRRRY